MTWLDAFEARKRSAEEALDAFLRPGQTLFIVGDLAEPLPLVEALLPRLERLAPLTIMTQIAGGRARFADDAYAEWVRLLALLPTRRLADRLASGNVQYVPCHSSQIPVWFKNGTFRADVALVQLTPPDATGHCGFGISRSFYAEVIASTPVVIAEVNRQMPRIPGDSAVAVADLAAVVETDRQLPEISPARIGPVEQRLGEVVAGLVPDAATVEFGIGGAPESALRQLRGHRDLGFHSGLLCDAAVDLLESGAVTNARKTVDRGVTVADVLLGTRRLFDYCYDNPLVQIRSSGYVHDIRTLAAQEGFVAINSAVEVDLLGQTNAETIDARRVSGVGGLLDFVRGAHASRGGRSIVVLPSTGRGGTVSRIVPRLAAGAAVSIPAADADWVVTEHGAACLRGKTASERTRALLAIAHPDFRAELRRAAEAS